MRRIEVLVFEGCPNVDTTVARASAAAVAAGVPADVTVVRVESEAEAVRQGNRKPKWGRERSVDVSHPTEATGSRLTRKSGPLRVRRPI